MLRFGGYLMRFYGKDYKTGLVKIVANLTNSSSSKKRFSNWPIRFPGSNLNSGEITGNVIGSALWKDLTAWARGLSPTSTTRSDAPRHWRPGYLTSVSFKNVPFLKEMIGGSFKISPRKSWFCVECHFCMKTCLRLCTAGWYCVTKGNICFE